MILRLEGYQCWISETAHTDVCLQCRLLTGTNPQPAEGAVLVLIGELLEGLDVPIAPRGLRVKDVGQERDEAQLLGGDAL